MSPYNQLQLVHKYPQIFKNSRFGGDPTKTCMAWGIECGDGWFELIDLLCADIMATNPPKEFKTAQIKEKFGGLRFYIEGGTTGIHKLIEEAEEESYHICEQCGSRENVTSKGSWITTLCAKCRGQ